jgi:hypothetical protein
VRLALDRVDPAMTVRYQPDAEGRACGACDACRIRKAVRDGGSPRQYALALEEYQLRGAQ